jgi:hypothetical protein
MDQNTDAAQAAIADGLPTEMVRAGEKPAAKAKREAAAKKHAAKLVEAKTEAQKTTEADAILASVAENKKAKAKGRIAKLKAVQSGETKKMPLTGKDATAALKLLQGGKAAKAPPAATGAFSKGKATKVASKPPKRTSEPRKGSARVLKVEAIGKLLRRPNGCTRPEVLAATGWPSVSMQQQAEALGVKLKQDKKPGELTRYFAA